MKLIQFLQSVLADTFLLASPKASRQTPSYAMVSPTLALVTLLTIATVLTTVSCTTPTSPGRMVPDGEIPTPQDIYRDAAAAKKVMNNVAPEGAITIFGSARSKPGNPYYDSTREFARLWSEQHGERFPILTGGSGGAMEAGNRGAHDAGAPSLYIATYFKGGHEESVNEYVTDGYLASSFAQREADLVDYAAGIIVAPGGVGTSWEIFESLSKIQTRKKAPCAIVLLGDRAVWQPLFDYMAHLSSIGTISPEDVHLLQLAETPEAAVALLEEGLSL